MKGKFFIIVLILASLILIYEASATHTVQCKGTARCLEGTVTKVKDGDTIVMNKTITSRFSLVNAPEKNEKNGKKAADFISKLCLNKQAKVDEDDKQRGGSYGRVVGVVYCGETNVNEALVKNNLTNQKPKFEKYCKISEFKNDDWAKTICKTEEKIKIKR